ATTSRATAIRLAEALGASRLVVGTYEWTDPELRLSLRLLDHERAALSARFIAPAPLETLGAPVPALAWHSALSGPHPPSPSPAECEAMRRAVPFDALRAYAEGLAASDPAARLKLLNRALALHPGYDDARITLGRTQLEAREWAAALETFARV